VTRWYQSTDHLYDRAAALQERYGPERLASFRTRIEGPDAEGRFTELVRQQVGGDDVVVDIGTGDGSWLMTNVAPLVRRAIGFDYAGRRLWLGVQRRASLGAANVEFLLADGYRIPLRDGAATAIINRRGPWTADDQFLGEGLRILRPGGLALEIGIGEENGRELEEAFGARNQMYAWRARGRSRLEELLELFRRYGLEPLVAESHVATEVMPSREAFVYRLETTPGIDGFDPEADAPLVDQIVAQCGRPDGIHLTVHRVCLVARKPK
jgi:SAM-dependent methyltransferase